MNGSIAPTDTAFQGINAAAQLAGMPWQLEKKDPATTVSPTKGRTGPIRRADVVIDSGALASLRQPASQDGRRFLGHVVVPGVLSLPEQDFTVRFSKHGFVINSHPPDSWPQLVIECESNSSTQDYTIKDVVWRLTTETVDGWLRHTCVILSLAKAGGFSVEAPTIGLAFDVKYDTSSDQSSRNQSKRVALQMARLIRKLKYIENCFNVKFRVPNVFSPDDVQLVEIVFRGITEGAFTTRSRDYTFARISSSDIDISRPPFIGSGSFSYRIEPIVSMFGKQLDVGPVKVSLAKAELADIGLVERLRKRSTITEKVRFEVLDNQITYRFETYARESRKHRVQRLNRFKKEVARHEPNEISALVEESLQGDVSSREAIQIAVGWQFYSHLPDRYCPQEPEIDDTTGHWRVPIWLVYPTGEGGPVGEVIVDKKSGEVVRHTPIDQLRCKGLALAETIFNA